MNITAIQIWPAGSKDGGLMAIHGLKVIQGKDGLFVAMPGLKTAGGEYRDLAHPVTAEARRALHLAVLMAFLRHKPGQARRQPSAS